MSLSQCPIVPLFAVTCASFEITLFSNNTLDLIPKEISKIRFLGPKSVVISDGQLSSRTSSLFFPAFPLRKSEEELGRWINVSTRNVSL